MAYPLRQPRYPFSCPFDATSDRKDPQSPAQGKSDDRAIFIGEMRSPATSRKKRQRAANPSFSLRAKPLRVLERAYTRLQRPECCCRCTVRLRRWSAPKAMRSNRTYDAIQHTHGASRTSRTAHDLLPPRDRRYQIGLRPHHRLIHLSAVVDDHEAALDPGKADREPSSSLCRCNCVELHGRSPFRPAAARRMPSVGHILTVSSALDHGARLRKADTFLKRQVAGGQRFAALWRLADVRCSQGVLVSGPSSTSGRCPQLVR